jgi:hypothetical protein
MTARHSLLRAGRRKQRTSTHAAANTHLSRFAHVGPVLLLDRRHAFPGHVRCRYSCPAAAGLAAAALGLPASRPFRTVLAQCSARPCASATPIRCDEPVMSGRVPVVQTDHKCVRESGG